MFVPKEKFSYTSVTRIHKALKLGKLPATSETYSLHTLKNAFSFFFVVCAQCLDKPLSYVFHIPLVFLKPMLVTFLKIKQIEGFLINNYDACLFI